MERQNSYSRPFLANTAASRVACVRNTRETLLLAKTSKGLSCETDGTLKTFFRERAKANDFLQKVHERRSGSLNAKCDGHGKVEVVANAEKNSFRSPGDEVKDEVKVRRARRISLDVNQTHETRKRIQEFLTRELPGQRGRSKGTQVEQSKVKDAGDKFGKEGFNLDTLFATESSEDHGKTQVTPKAPFRVRSRASGICLSHSHCHLQRLPSAKSMPSMQRELSEPLFVMNSPCIFRSSLPRKLSTPVPQMFLERNKLDYVNTGTPYLPPTRKDETPRGQTVVRRRSLTPMPTKKHSI